MYAVETYAAVRQFVFIEGKSRREASRVFGLSRDTINKMCRFSAPPGYQRTKEPEKPKLGPLIAVIDAILQADRTAPPKQRHTAKRVFERLKAELHLRHLLLSYMKYFNEARTHLSLNKDAPIPRAVQAAGRILCWPILGGLHHQYGRI
jgi:hypothetical protein